MVGQALQATIDYIKQQTIMEYIIGRISRETDTETNTETEMDIVAEMEMEKGNRKGKIRERMATWNVTGLGDHIPEIVEIMKKMKIAVLGISDSSTKGSGSIQIDSNFVYTWSGRDTHADHGVGFIVDEQHSQAIMEIRPINLRLHLKIQAKNVIENYIQCYAPLNTDGEDVKDEFFENLHDTLADIQSTEQIYLMGDVCTQTIWDHTEEVLGMTMEKGFWRYVQVTT